MNIRRLPLVAKRLLNVMAEKQARRTARTTAGAGLGTPGLVPYTPIGTGPIVAMNDDVPGAIYIVSGTEAFRMSFDPGGNPTFEGIGNVGTPDARHQPVEQLRHHCRRTDWPSLSAPRPTPIPAAICPASC